MDSRLEKLTAVLNEARQLIKDYNNYHDYLDGHILSVHLSEGSDGCEVFMSPVLPDAQTPIYSQDAITGGYKDWTFINGIQFYTFSSKDEGITGGEIPELEEIAF